MSPLTPQVLLPKAAALPLSDYASEEARAALLQLAVRPYPVPEGCVTVAGPAVDEWRRKLDEVYYQPLLAAWLARFPAKISPRPFGTVYADLIEPLQGVAPDHERRILINLHGGGFVLGARTGGLADSVPLVGHGGFRILTVDYRQGPEHRFPAGTEDVVAVYRELLEDYPAANIGIFGCSAGGVLTAQVTAWLQVHGLPAPGAIAILAAGAEARMGGDSGFLWGDNSAEQEDGYETLTAYFQGADRRSPLVSPVHSPATLAGFPPTLVMTSTRAFDLSAAVYTDLQLTRAGAVSELHVWDGIGHGEFLNNPAAPEADDAYAFLARFFDRHLGREAGR